MQKLVIIVILFSLNAYSQLIDINCDELVQSGGYVKGSLDKNARTERGFNYPKLISDYENIRTQINTQKNLSPDCKGQKNLNSCPSFKMYCVQELVVYALQEDLKEWTTAVKNCNIPEYLERFPKHCMSDHTKSLEYIMSQAEKVGMMMDGRSAHEENFSKNAYKFFSAYKDQPKKLVQALKVDSQQHNARKNMLNLIDKCHGVTLLEDNDVKDRQITNHLHNSFVCMMPEQTAIDTVGASAFRNDLAQINSYAHAEVSFPKFLEHALKKALEAMWVTHLQQYGEIKPNLYEYTCKQAPDVCFTSSGKQMLKQTISEFEDKQAKKPTKFKNQAEIKLLMEQDLNNKILNFQKVCKEVKLEYKKIEDQYSCHNLNLNNPNSLKNVSETQCQHLQQERYQRNKVLLRNSKSKIEAAYKNVLSSELAHLGLSPIMQNKSGIGTFNPEFTYEQCMKGDGIGLREVNWETVSKAQQEFLNLNIANVKELAADDLKPFTSKEKLYQKYAKQHFIEMAEFLWDNPSEENAIAICNAIRSLYSKENARQIIDYVLTGTGAVATIALMATGAGAPMAPVLWSALGISSAAQAASALEQHLSYRDEASLTANAASAGQVELELALDKIRHDNQEADSQMDAMINLLALEATGLGLTKTISLYSKLKNAPILMRIIRGREVMHKNLDVNDLKMIRSGLEKFKDGLKAKGVNPRSLDNLTGEELAELGARMSKMKQSQIDEIFAKLEPTHPQKLGKEFLNILREGKKFDIAKLNRLLEHQPKFKYPHGVDLNHYLIQSHVAIKRTKPITTVQLYKNKVVNGVNRYIHNYGRNQYGKRTFKSMVLRTTILKNRPITHPNRKFSEIFVKQVKKVEDGKTIWVKKYNSAGTNEFLMNPVATSLNKSKMITNRAQIALWTIGEGAIKGNKLNQKLEEVFTKKAEIPGGNYAWSLLEQGLIDPAKMPALMAKHNNALNQWLDTKSWKSLPRLAYLKDKFGLTEAEAQLISQMAWESYFEEIKKAQESGAQSTEEDLNLFHNSIISNLYPKIMESAELGRLPTEVKDALWSVYHPVLDLKDGMGTDVDWALKFSYGEADPDVKKILPYMQSKNNPGQLVMSYEEGIALMIKNRDKKLLAQKKDKANEDLPEDLRQVAERADFSIVSKPHTFGMKGYQVELKDELDRWKVVATDPRFKESYDYFKQGKIEEYSFMQFVEHTIGEYNQLYAAIENPGKYTEDEILSNSLMKSIHNGMLQTLEARGASEEDYLELRPQIIANWLEFYKAQAQGEDPSIDEYFKRHEAILNQ